MERNSNQRPLTVTELTQRIKKILESELRGLLLEGEISNLRVGPSNHHYLTLKDAHAQLPAVLWATRAQRLRFRLEDGMKVFARGSITVYPPHGKYQFDIAEIEPLGTGELQIAFEQLKKRLSDEGLFDPERKRPLPKYLNCVGIVTSETGAVIRDIITTVRRRFPALQLILASARVQGEDAPAEIVRGIDNLNRSGKCDAIIVARGGGSLEDLWAFNTELVARAIISSRVPVISAVGHETDFTIADFVSDLRAPTPTGAAEVVAPDSMELLDSISKSSYLLRRDIKQILGAQAEYCDRLLQNYAFRRPSDLVNQYAKRLGDNGRFLSLSIGNFLGRVEQRFEGANTSLGVLAPESVLARGYAIVRKEGAAIARASGLKTGDEVTVQFKDGSKDAVIR